MITGFSLDIYDSDIAFAWDTNEKELSAFLDKVKASQENREEFFKNINNDNAGAITVCCCGRGTSTITVFHDEPNNKIVAHEIYHIAYRILNPRGIEDEEAWAYLIGYLTEMFYDLYLEKDETTKDSTPSGND